MADALAQGKRGSQALAGQLALAQPKMGEAAKM